METSMWLALASIALGTYLLRLLPYLWMKAALTKKQMEGGISAMPSWLTILGPTMIAAMFGTSLVPAHLDTISWLATGAGTLVTFAVWTRTRSMGLPILCGVAAFGMIMLSL
ncbi:branched-chain amino acid ABC transporter [Oceanospirillum linum]|uniref:Branched-chain amino acid ABC transporter n=2 Tax=Oceanospirillum linum TaxID=966 RepID=A0A1T1HBH4_OCELI|nr:branched-chain amino acid ABC transporter [Oceanospirillum linum]SEF73734.1 Branched-chain amino acid transport protein (AzlD) [Oleiphilus messinensis]SMP16488.1 Branched-chain amino acid transport protein (AzlD) [Oceanospirillum linum]